MAETGAQWVSRPAFIVALVVAIAAWIALNASRALTWDPPPHHFLELAAGLVALVIALLILATQRREDELAERRAQLSLQLALLADKKTAKIIALLEELRRDDPALRNRQDEACEELAKPTDPKAVLAAIEDADSAEAAVSLEEMRAP